MNVTDIKTWAEANDIESFDLLLAANEIDKALLYKKIKEKGGKYQFTDESEYPCLICSCFDEIIEVKVLSVEIADEDVITISCKEIDNNSIKYNLSINDFVIGQLRLITSEMI